MAYVKISADHTRGEVVIRLSPLAAECYAETFSAHNALRSARGNVRDKGLQEDEAKLWAAVRELKERRR